MVVRKIPTKGNFHNNLNKQKHSSPIFLNSDIQCNLRKKLSS